MPRKKIVPTPGVVPAFAPPPNIASLSEVRVYRLKDGAPVNLKVEISGPLAIQARVAEEIERLHEAFRVEFREDDDPVPEVGEQRKRETRHYFARFFVVEGGE